MCVPPQGPALAQLREHKDAADRRRVLTPDVWIPHAPEDEDDITHHPPPSCKPKPLLFTLHTPPFSYLLSHLTTKHHREPGIPARVFNMYV